MVPSFRYIKKPLPIFLQLSYLKSITNCQEGPPLIRRIMNFPKTYTFDPVETPNYLLGTERQN